MKIFNGTSHEITFYNKTDTESINGGRKLILKEGSQPCFVLKAGTNLNCQKSNKNLLIDSADSPIPLVGAVQFTSADTLPDGYDLYVVSNLYRAALVELKRDTSKIATVSETVYQSEDDVRPCGCCQLAVG